MLWKLLIVREIDSVNQDYKAEEQAKKIGEVLGTNVIIFSSTDDTAVKTAEIIAKEFNKTFEATDKVSENTEFDQFFEFLKSVEDSADNTIIVIAHRKYLEDYFKWCIYEYEKDLLLPNIRILRGNSNPGEALLFDFCDNTLRTFFLW